MGSKRLSNSLIASWTCATLDQAANLQEESHPCLAAGECLAAVSLHDVERNPSSRRIRHALDEQRGRQMMALYLLQRPSAYSFPRRTKTKMAAEKHRRPCGGSANM